MQVLKQSELLDRALGIKSDVSDATSDSAVLGVAYDSRKIKKDEIFCCLLGGHFDGHHFADEALRAGAAALIVNHRLDLDIPQYVVSDTRQAMALLACEYWGHPSKNIACVGVTGTNGKTTVTHFLAELLGDSAVIGTLSGNLTTPEAPDLQSQLAQLCSEAKTLATLEVSSHGLVQQRTVGMEFEAVVFLNLGRDHLDFHGDMEAYFESKSLLFNREKHKLALINTDSKWGRRLFEAHPAAIGFSVENVTIQSLTSQGSVFIWEGQECRLNMAGEANIANSVAALETAKALGHSISECVERLEKLMPVPGRFEILQTHPYVVVIDYAHTPDALEKVLDSARKIISDKNVLVLFGCGGERDKQKRPEMGRTAELYADKIFLTSDNSRFEEPADIIAEIQSGMHDQARMKRHAKYVKVEPDRRKAIEMALNSAEEGDLLLIAGKGHETEQIDKQGVRKFNDREVVEELLELGK